VEIGGESPVSEASREFPSLLDTAMPEVYRETGFWRIGMTRFNKWLLVFNILAFVTGCLACGFLLLREFVIGMDSPEMMILISPNRNERVFLFGEGFQDHDISLCVPSDNDTKIKRIVSWRFQDFDAVWSGDGSVLAFEFNDDYIFAYDLKFGQAIPSDMGPWIERSYRPNSEDVERIKTLMRERGTPKYRIPCSMFRTFVPMRYSQWRKFKAALWAAEHPGEANPRRK
jgi:hypothetical protein